MSTELHSKGVNKLVLGDREKVPHPAMNGDVKDRIQAEYSKSQQDGRQTKTAGEKTIGTCRGPQEEWECQNFKDETVVEKSLHDVEEDDDDEDQDKDVNPYFDLQALRSHYPVSCHLVYLWKGEKTGTSQQLNKKAEKATDKVKSKR